MYMADVRPGAIQLRSAPYRSDKGSHRHHTYMHS